MFIFTVPVHLKVLIPHEVQSLFDFGDGAGTFPAEVCGCASVQIIGALLLSEQRHRKTWQTNHSITVPTKSEIKRRAVLAINAQVHFSPASRLWAWRSHAWRSTPLPLQARRLQQASQEWLVTARQKNATKNLKYCFKNFCVIKIIAVHQH